MTKAKSTKFLDDEERAIVGSFEDALESGAIRPSSEAERDRLRTEWKGIMAGATARKAVTLRLQERDIERLKAIAREKGMPYQTLVASVLHQFALGTLRERGA